MEEKIKTEKQPIENSVPEKTPPVLDVPKAKPKLKLPILIGGIILFLVLIGCASAYLLLSKQKTTDTQKQVFQGLRISTPTPDLTPTQGSSHITRLRPDKGPIGTLVTVDGTNFTSDYNIIQFGSDDSYSSIGLPNNAIDSATSRNSSDGKDSIEFIIPGPSIQSGPSTGKICNYLLQCIPVVQRNIMPGTYPVSVSNRQGHSNTLNFTVIQVDQGPASKLIPGWKTYVDTTYGFTIDYPSDSGVSYRPDQPYVNDDGYTLGFKFVTVSFSPNPDKLSATNFVKQEAFKNDLPGWDNNKKPIIPLNLKEIDAVEVNNIVGGAGGFGSEVFISDGANIIKLLATDSTPATESKLQQMLSTFKFTK